MWPRAKGPGQGKALLLRSGSPPAGRRLPDVAWPVACRAQRRGPLASGRFAEGKIKNAPSPNQVLCPCYGPLISNAPEKGEPGLRTAGQATSGKA